MLARSNHLDVAIEQRQVVVVGALLLECERAIAAPGEAAIERRRPRLGASALPAAPDAVVSGDADFVSVDLIRARTAWKRVAALALQRHGHDHAFGRERIP